MSKYAAENLMRPGRQNMASLSTRPKTPANKYYEYLPIIVMPTIQSATVLPFGSGGTVHSDHTPSVVYKICRGQFQVFKRHFHFPPCPTVLVDL